MNAETSHAPAPSPEQRLAERGRPPGPVLGHQRWDDLLFAHWRVDPQAVQATLPPGLFVDTLAGEAFVGVVPFFMRRVRPRWLPGLPWISAFLELNVRTYVHDARGRPGVWFYSLDCNQPVAVTLARRFFHLPYEHARMRARRVGEAWQYDCQRSGVPTVWRSSWQPPAGGVESVPGTLEFFLVERYTLYAADRAGRLYAGRVWHAPYRVEPAQGAQCTREPATLAGFDIKGAPVSLLASPGVQVEIFPLRRLVS